jgi:hypothetical protein
VNGEKDVDDIRTLMEEIDLRIKETKQETYEFKRDVILGQWLNHAEAVCLSMQRLPPARLQDCRQRASIASTCDHSAALHAASQVLRRCAVMYTSDTYPGCNQAGAVTTRVYGPQLVSV